MPGKLPVYMVRPRARQHGAGWYVSPSKYKDYFEAFTAQTALTITQATHGLRTAQITCVVTDATDPTVEIAATVTVDAVTFEVGITFSGSQSGTVRLLAVMGDEGR